MDHKKLQADLHRMRRQFYLLYEMGNLMRTTLNLDETLFLILSAVTSHEGLGFNRAILFLTNKTRTHLKGAMGIGPKSPEKAQEIWQDIDEYHLKLDGFLDIYRKSEGKIDTDLNQVIKSVNIPLKPNESVIAQTALEQMPMAILTDETRKKVKHDFLDKIYANHFALVPVRGKEGSIGTLMVDNISTQKEISKDEIFNLKMFADHAGLAIENAFVYSHILEVSKKDSLTGLWNHAHFQELLQQSIQVSKLQNTDLSIIIFDVDDFKKYNDELGHQQGDKALKELSVLAKKTLRRNDYIARYGGEEFGIILPGTPKDKAIQIAEKLRTTIENQTFKLRTTHFKKQVTISLGISTYPEDADDREKLIYAADASLYQAKKSGKNTAISYEKP